MIEQLFGSKTRVKLLQLFYSNPNRSFYVREITRKIDEQINSVRRELSNLLNVGIISSENTNNKLYYEVNKSFEFYAPLSQIFGAAGAVATATDESSVGAPAAGLKALGNVEMALYTGQFTRDERSGVDFVVVGDVNPTQLAKYVSDLEKKEGKTIRYAVMDKDEFAYRMRVNDRFLLTVLESKKQILLDRAGLISQVIEVEEAPDDEPRSEKRAAEPKSESKDKKEKAKK
jgi:hypothetical protein